VSLNPQWDARQPLAGTPEGLGRKIGVLVGQPFHHHGLNATYVDISRETPRLNTDTYGNCYPIEETAEQARVAFEETIGELDALIAHLVAHRERMAADVARLPDHDFSSRLPEQASRQAGAVVQGRSTPAVVDVPLPDLPAA
jgi:hypothetical protein